MNTQISSSREWDNFIPVNFFILGLIVIFVSWPIKAILMYSLNCDYYTREFSNIDDLISDIMSSGMDPNYEITFNGVSTGELAADLLQY